MLPPVADEAWRHRFSAFRLLSLRPKSPILPTQSRETSTLGLFTSRCTTGGERPCRKARPLEPSSARRSSAGRSTSHAFEWMTPYRLPHDMSSHTIFSRRREALTATPRIMTMFGLRRREGRPQAREAGE